MSSDVDWRSSVMASSDLFNKTNDFKQYRYHVNTIQVKIPGNEVISIDSERMIEFSIAHLYEYNMFPLFRVTMSLEASVYYKILKNKNDAKLYLRIDNYYTIIDNSDPSIYYSFINDTFDMIMDEGTDDMLAAQKESEASTNYSSITDKDTDDMRHIEDAIFSVYLFKEDVIKGTKTNITTVLKNATVTDAIAYCLTKGNIKNVIMAPPDNKKVYKELILPPLSINKELSFIDTYYGLYKEGTMIYFGLNYNYIIPYNGKCEAYISSAKSVISILVPDSSNSHLSAEGELNYGTEESKNIYLVASFHTINIENQSISNNYTTSNDVYMIDNYNGDTSQAKSSAVTKSGSTTKIIENSTENPYITTMFTAQNNALSTVIHLNIDNTNLSWLEPNRRYTVIFEDAKYANKYKGNYILAESLSTFIKDGLDFTINTEITLKHE